MYDSFGLRLIVISLTMGLNLIVDTNTVVVFPTAYLSRKVTTGHKSNNNNLDLNRYRMTRFESHDLAEEYICIRGTL